MKFRFVQYGNTEYPSGITPELIEHPGHLDKDRIEDAPKYSIHTEYSYGKRNLSSDLVRQFPALCEANKDGVPQLWKSTDWAEQFAGFVIKLTESHAAPLVVEIHPPFNDYCDIDQFLERYQTFERIIHQAYPGTEIVVENRSGAVYRGGRFIVGKGKEIALLCKRIQETGTDLGVVLDFPQLVTAEHLKTNNFDADKYMSAIDAVVPYQSVIKGIHIWGKKQAENGRWVAHCGTLDTYFPDTTDRDIFIEGIRKVCSDGRARLFVPEVNSGAEDLRAVVSSVIGL